MTTSVTEESETAQSTTATRTNSSKKPRPGAQRAHVAPSKAKSVKKPGLLKKAPKTAQKPTRKRDGSKTAQILDLLKRPGGATGKELMKVTGWQAHSVRGFLSGTVGKKMGLAITSTKGDDGEGRYSVNA
jgi:hypothetical protein